MEEIVDHKVSETHINWTPTTERFILYADFMGFSSRVYGKKHDEIQKELVNFRKNFEDRALSLEEGGKMNWVQFSDSILIAVNGDDTMFFQTISDAAVILMQTSMELGIPLKGVIAKGEFTFEKSNQLFFGRPLVDAYRLHDEIKFYGIVVHHSAQSCAKQLANYYSNRQVQFKSGKIAHYHLVWNLFDITKEDDKPTVVSPVTEKDDVNVWIERISESVSGEPRKYIDCTLEMINQNEDFRHVKSTDSDDMEVAE